MQFISQTIAGLFSQKIQFTIPVYQRAYSWRQENWIVFLQDLIDQSFTPTLVNEVAGMFGTSLSSVLIKFVDYVPLPLKVTYLQDDKVLWSRSRGGTLTGNEHSFKANSNELRVMW